MLYTIAIATGCALIGVIMGSIVQRTARFLYPIDWMSIAIMAGLTIDAILGLAPWEPIWYIPYLLGFWVGYLLVGRTRYVMALDVSIPSKIVVMRPWVLYDHNGVTCIQKQTNRDLLRRQLFGAHNELVDDTGAPIQIEPDWHSDSKYPMFPAFEKPLIVLEKCEEISEVRNLWLGIKIRIPSTVITLGFASSTSKLTLLKSADVLDQQQRMIVQLNGEVHRLMTAQGPKLMEMAIRINNKAQKTTPENRMFELLMTEDVKKTKNGAKARLEEMEVENDDTETAA